MNAWYIILINHTHWLIVPCQGIIFKFDRILQRILHNKEAESGDTSGK